MTPTPDGTDPRDALTQISSPAKRRLFDELVARDGARCQWCGVEADLTIDHIDPGGPTILSNLQLLCRPHNSEKGNRADKTVRWDLEVWQAGFTMVPNKVLLEAPLTANALRVYILFQFFANRPNDEWPGQDGFSTLARCSDKTFRACVAELEGFGLLRSRRRGLGLTNAYVLLAPRAGSFRSRPVKTSDQDLPDSSDPSVLSNNQVLERTSPLPPPLRNRPTKVDRQPVTDAEYQAATAILAAFNEIAGTKFSGKDFVAKIVMRVREHPDLTVEAHTDAIRATFAEHWWKGVASPSVVYGNAAVFETALARAATPTVEAADDLDRPLSPTEIEAYLREPLQDPADA